MWVKTSEKLPDKPGLYFAYGECQNTVYILEYDHEYGWYSEDKKLEKTPKYWQEITYPEPPKIELEEEKYYWVKTKYKGRHPNNYHRLALEFPTQELIFIKDTAEIKPVED